LSSVLCGIDKYFVFFRRIDHRELVRDLYGLYKARIWMEPVTQFPFRLVDWAAVQLATGIPQPGAQQQHFMLQQQHQALVQQHYTQGSQHNSPMPSYQQSPSFNNRQQQQQQYLTQFQQLQQQHNYHASSTPVSVHSSPASSSSGGYSSGLAPSPHNKYRGSPQLNSFQQRPYVIPKASPRQQQGNQIPVPSPILSSRFLGSPRQTTNTFTVGSPGPSPSLSMLSPVISSNSIAPMTSNREQQQLQQLQQQFAAQNLGTGLPHQSIVANSESIIHADTLDKTLLQSFELDLQWTYRQLLSFTVAQSDVPYICFHHFQFHNGHQTHQLNAAQIRQPISTPTTV
jgi:hypothetical protein